MHRLFHILTLALTFLPISPSWAHIHVDHEVWTDRAEAVYADMPPIAKLMDVRLVKISTERAYYIPASYTGDGIGIVNMHTWSKNVFHHEMGHHIHSTILRQLYPQVYSDWETVWQQNRAKMPTDYARKNSQEGFAVCFGRWFRGSDGLNSILRRWMDTNIGR